MNAMVGERMSVITPKAQTTRHRIIGIVNEPDMQIVFSDTPGMIEPKYGLQRSMMSSVNESLGDADVILLVTDVNERHDEGRMIEKLKRMETPLARSEEHTSELQSLMRISYAVFCLKKKKII